MSWFSAALTKALPFVQSIAADKNFQAAGEAAFKGIARQITQHIGNPAALHELAAVIDQKAPELVGAIAAKTEAAHLVEEDVMPPGSKPEKA